MNSHVKLSKFRLLAYRSCKDVVFLPNENFTVLIGPNGVGKTNVMNGILLLSLGGRRRNRTSLDELSENKCGIEADFLVGEKLIRYKATITHSQAENGRDEVASADEKWNFKAITGKSAWIKDQNFVPDYYYISKGLYAHELKLRMINKKMPKDVLETYKSIQSFRKGITYYSASQYTNPSLCPTSFEIDEERDEIVGGTLQSRRTAHTRFVYELYRLSQADKKAYKNFLSLVGQDGVGLINDIEWRDTVFSSHVYEVRAGGKVVTKNKKRVLIIPMVTVGSSQLSFNQLSEGTLRTLAMVFYVITDRSQLLMLEEPEVCVHHGLLKSVIEIIKRYSKTRQMIISTHSELLLDNVEPEQVMLVDKDRDGTTVSSVNKILGKSGINALKNYLSTVGSLGEYWRHGGFQK